MKFHACVCLIVPTVSARRYTQVLETRHSGQGCRNPSSKDGKLWVTTDALVSTERKLLLGKSHKSSACTTD